jgi:hypothetical protein
MRVGQVALLSTACLVACGSEAISATPQRGLAAAGPALAGSAVVWGEERGDGSLAVVRRAAGGRARVVHRIAAPKGKHRRRAFGGVPGGLSASSTWIAYAQDDATVEVDGDSVSSEVDVRAYGSRNGGPFRDLLPGCGGAAYISTASEGDAVAIGQSSGECGGRDAGRVWLIEGQSPPRLLYESADPYLSIRQVQLAGPWLAWSEGGTGAGDTKITVVDRASGAVAAHYEPTDFAGGRTFRAFDIDAAGNVAALSGPQPRCYYVCVTVRNVKGGARRTITRRAIDRTVAIAGGRIAYASQRHGLARRIVVTRLDGTVVRRLGRFGRSRQPIHDLALTPRRVAWAVVQDGEVDATSVRVALTRRR